MRRWPMASFMSLTQVRSLGASPSIAVLAVRRKLETRDAGDLDGVLHREEEPGAGALVDLHREDVLAVEGHGAGGDRVLRVAGDRVGQGRLAGPVGAHDRVRLAGLDGQGDAAEDLLGALLGLDGDVEVLDLKGGHAVAQLSSDRAT